MIKRIWTRSLESINPKSMSIGLRYDAGDWFAEILGDSWRSYTILKQQKHSDSQIEELLQEHESPRLPRDCFFVEQFPYQMISAQSIQFDSWICQSQEVLQAQQQDFLQPIQSSLSAQRKHPQPLTKKEGRPNSQQSPSSLPSSNQAARGPQQLQGRGKQGQRNQVQSSKTLPFRGFQGETKEKPSQLLPGKQPLQHQGQVVSSVVPITKSTYSPHLPKNLQVQPKKQRPIVSGSLMPVQVVSVCQIQD